MTCFLHPYWCFSFYTFLCFSVMRLASTFFMESTKIDTLWVMPVKIIGYPQTHPPSQLLGSPRAIDGGAGATLPLLLAAQAQRRAEAEQEAAAAEEEEELDPRQLQTLETNLLCKGSISTALEFHT